MSIQNKQEKAIFILEENNLERENVAANICNSS